MCWTAWWAVSYTHLDVYKRQGVIVAGAVRPAAARVHAEVRIENAHRWQGVKDPYLYAVEALLTVHNETIDNAVSYTHLM